MIEQLQAPTTLAFPHEDENEDENEDGDVWGSGTLYGATVEKEGLHD